MCRYSWLWNRHGFANFDRICLGICFVKNFSDINYATKHWHMHTYTHTPSMIYRIFPIPVKINPTPHQHWTKLSNPTYPFFECMSHANILMCGRSRFFFLHKISRCTSSTWFAMHTKCHRVRATASTGLPAQRKTSNKNSIKLFVCKYLARSVEWR